MSAQGTNEVNQAKFVKPKSQETRKKFGTGDGGKGRQDKPHNSKFKYDNSSRPKFDGGRQGGVKRDQGNNGYQMRFMKDKDDDEADNGRRSKPMRPKENKQQTIQLDKTRTQLRFEKEQKTVKKKQAGNKKKESSRPQVKVKRANNINYTKEYLNGAFDDYEDYYE